jgi:hypothetical protein
MKKYIKSFLITAALIVGLGFMAPAQPALAQQANATYSCGAYGSSTYNNNDSCNGVTPPNTGFAKLTEPGTIIPIGIFLAVIAAGIIVIFKTRKQKKSQD